MRRAAACSSCRGTRTRVLFRKGGRDFVRCEAAGSSGSTRCRRRPRSAPTTSSPTGRHLRPYAAAETIRRWIAEHRLAAIRPTRARAAGSTSARRTGHFVETAARAGMAAEGCELSTRRVVASPRTGLTVHHTAVRGLHRRGTVRHHHRVRRPRALRGSRAFLDRLRSWLVPGGHAGADAARREQHLPAAHAPALVLLRAERPPALLRPADDHASPREHGFARARVTRAYKR
jgi:hypothetical protein